MGPPVNNLPIFTYEMGVDNLKKCAIIIYGNVLSRKKAF